MHSTKNRKIVLKSYPVGAPTEANFEIVEEAIPSPGPGQALVRSIYLTVDPYMRGRLRPGPSYARPQQIGEVMVGEAAGEVIVSNAPGLKKGDFVAAHVGWQTHGIVDGRDARRLDPDAAPISTSLGVLGMPGLTAYFGTLDVLRPRAGDTLVVNAAAGAVGSVVGQIARIGGCRVVGIAGSDDKVDFITKELGFDAGINHRTTNDMRRALAAACPGGIDCYFDNVGGPMTDAAIDTMAFGARIAICGQIGLANDTEQAMGPRNLRMFLIRRATLQGLLVSDWADRYDEGLARLGRWIREGRLKYREDIVEGLEQTPAAFAGLMEGRNFGKQLIRVGDDPTRR